MAHLAEFKEVTSGITMTLMGDNNRPISASFPTESPKKLLERQYTVLQFNWTSGMSQQLINFPGVLFEQIAIQNVMDNFKYFRASVKIQIKFQATEFHQGSLLIGWLPGWNGTSNLPLTTLSGCNPVVLPATTEAEATITMPYINPFDWIDTEVIPSTDSRIGTLFISELNPLIPTAPSQAASIPVNVFANFVNTEVQTPQSLVPSMERIKTMRRMKGKAHMSSSDKNDKSNKESALKAKRGTDWSGTKFAMSMASKLFRMAPVVGPIWGTFADFMNGIDGEWSKPIDHTAQQPVLYSPFSDYAKARDLTTADELSLYPNALVTSGETLHGMETSHQSIGKLAQRPMLYNTFVLSSPSTVKNFSVTPFYTAYDEEGVSANTDWLSEMARICLYWRGSIKYLFHFVAPKFYSCRVIIWYTHQQGTINTIDELPHVVVNVKGDTWAEMCVPFSRAHTWTVPFNEVSNTNIPRISIALLTPIVGSTAPTTPILYVNIWRAGGEDTAFVGTQNPNNYLTASSGTHHRDLKREKGNAHCSIDEKFKKPFENIAGSQQSFERGDTAAEILGTVADLMKRASEITNGYAVGGSHTYTQPFGFQIGTGNVNYWTTGCEFYNYFSAFFLFWKGSRILRRWLGNTSNQMKPISMNNITNNQSQFSDGIVLWSQAVQQAPQLRDAVQAHWQCATPYAWVQQPGMQINTRCINQDGVISSIPNDLAFSGPSLPAHSYLSVAAGDDFTLMYPVPFFPSTYYPLIPGKKKNPTPEQIKEMVSSTSATSDDTD